MTGGMSITLYFRCVIAHISINVIAMEIHEVQKTIAQNQNKAKNLIKKQRSKRMKKLSDNEKIEEIGLDIPYVENYIVAAEIDIEIPKKTNRCNMENKIKKATAEEYPHKVRIYEVEKHNVPDESDGTPLNQH